jgi:FKBP-type peptidyl-prolyl cis-trans isomerase 2
MPESGDTVHVHYTGRLDDGTEFDSSRGRDPLSFTLGAGQVIAGFDKAVADLAVGESTTVRLEPAEAYGEVDEELVIAMARPAEPADLAEGMQVQLSNGARATIAELTDDTVVLDANHPLAGEALTFDLELVSVG